MVVLEICEEHGLGQQDDSHESTTSMLPSHPTVSNARHLIFDSLHRLYITV